MHFDMEKLVCPTKYKAAVLVCILMLIIGSAGFQWVSADKEKENLLQIELDQLTAESIESINNVVAGKGNTDDLEKINRKNQLQTELEIYKTRIEKRELITIISFVAVSLSAAIIGWGFLFAVIYG